MTDETAGDPWSALRRLTGARIGLARSGAGLATAPSLALRLAHAEARDAVAVPLDADALEAAIPGPVLRVRSQAPDRATFKLRPDLGRRLHPDTQLERGDYDLAVVLADGLSARAVQVHAPATLAALLPLLPGWRMAPVVVALQARVALGDAVAGAIGARAALVMIGERPGLSAPDSLGLYLTWRPHPGTTDAERNCISNVRPAGLPPDAAARKLAWLLQEARVRGLTGIALKDGAGDPLPELPGGSRAALMKESR